MWLLLVTTGIGLTTVTSLPSCMGNPKKTNQTPRVRNRNAKKHCENAVSGIRMILKFASVVMAEASRDGPDVENS